MRTLEDIRLALDWAPIGLCWEQWRWKNRAWSLKQLSGGVRIALSWVLMRATAKWRSTVGKRQAELIWSIWATRCTRWVCAVVYTDINRDAYADGRECGCSARLGDVTGLNVIASGGVAGIKDIELLKAHEHYNIDGVIVGQALYTGNLDLRRAVEVGHEPLRRRSAGIIPYRNTEHGPEFLLLFNLFFEQWQFPRGGSAPR